jgi:hypothetical protein
VVPGLNNNGCVFRDQQYCNSIMLIPNIHKTPINSTIIKNNEKLHHDIELDISWKGVLHHFQNSPEIANTRFLKGFQLHTLEVTVIITAFSFTQFELSFLLWMPVHIFQRTFYTRSSSFLSFSCPGNKARILFLLSACCEKEGLVVSLSPTGTWEPNTNQWGS